MLRMVIVDDENIIRESLFHFIDWKSIDIEVIGVADNGSKALEMILKDDPDIILTDISMPMLSGIELIQMLREKNIKSEIIFISAYNNFDYAKKALQFGAFDYILKPINENQLLETVKKCAEKINHAKEVSHLLLNITNDKKQLLNDSLEKLFYHNNPLSHSEQKIIEASGITTEKFHTVIAAGMNNQSSVPYVSKDIILPLFGTYLIHSIVTKDNLNIVILFSQEKDLSVVYKTFYDFLLQHKEGYVNQGIQYISMSKPYAFEEAFHYIASEILLLQVCGQNNASFFKIQNIDDFLNSSRKILANDLLVQAKQAIENHELKKLFDIITSFFLSSFSDNSIYDLDLMKLKCIDFIDTIINELNSYQIANYFGEKHMSTKKNITSQFSIDQIFDVTKNILTNLSLLINDNRMKSSHHLVKLTLDYIHQNYQNNISLTEISSKLYVSPTYLSMLFSRDVGEPFSRYVLNYRVQIAKTMLQNPKYKVYEIAELTGFTDVAHFSKAFKQIEKKSPKKYLN